MLNNKAFTLIELIIVIAIGALIAAAIFVFVNPAQRLGDAKDAVRALDATAIEKAIQNKIADVYTVPATMAALTENTPYMLVTEGAATAGTCNCNTLDQAIGRVDLAGEFEAYLGSSIPVDEDATGDDTGYYITRKGNSFYVESCNAYGDEFVAAPICGNGILEGAELCDSDLATACPFWGGYYYGDYVGTGLCSGEYACNNTCGACINMLSCETP